MKFVDSISDHDLGLVLLTPDLNIRWLNNKTRELFVTEHTANIERILLRGSNLRKVREKNIFSIKVYAESEDIICYPVDSYKDYILIILLSKSSLISLINYSQVDINKNEEILHFPYIYNPGSMVPSNSPLVKKMIDNCFKVANHDTTILITGESGVGKEVVARLIHRAGNRMNGELLCVNCGCIPETLLEAELFGYEDGAFTGARKGGKAGLFQVAQGGTIFLDEIGELPASLQVKLLRVIQEKQIYRIGGNVPISIDVRIIASTNIDLKQQIRKGLFREDLYYRLNVIPIMIPPLRERVEDIASLTAFFINKYNQQFGLQKKFAPEAISLLQQYSWPGNIRQLENFIQRVLVFADSDFIDYQNVKTFLDEEYAGLHIAYDDGAQVSLQAILDEAEEKALFAAKEKYHTTREIAKHLEISQASVVRKLKKYSY